MDIFLVVAPVFGTNCTIVAPGSQDVPDGAARPCVIVDAGAGVVPGVTALVREHGLSPTAVLATHGHADHTWDAAELCDLYGVPLWIHAADAYRLADPLGTIEHAPSSAGGRLATGPLAAALAAGGALVEDYREPGDVRTFGSGGADGTPGTPGPGGTSAADQRTRLDLGGVLVDALHAPGHTQGSTLYLPLTAGDEHGTSGAARDGQEAAGVVLAGDVLFAGSVGRTDLPGGDGETMQRTLRDVVGHLDDSLQVVPGHGPLTTVGRERRTNPYLRGL
ncbi:MBL fold metallo-hydrolase [Oerskovia sp. NPDC057915]|uniref:MBL fold metallo-hydrolase n=1 Tax=Oerskovia sp. NPDC057915 TaxID=3346280 RepID=UPI0036DEFCD7